MCTPLGFHEYVVGKLRQMVVLQVQDLQLGALHPLSQTVHLVPACQQFPQSAAGHQPTASKHTVLAVRNATGSFSQDGNAQLLEETCLISRETAATDVCYQERSGGQQINDGAACSNTSEASQSIHFMKERTVLFRL